MILHIATFVFHDHVTEAQIEAATTALYDMAAQIPEIKSYVAGPNLHLRPGGKDFGVTALVDDADGVHAYLDHPLHTAAYEQHLAVMIAERAAVQLAVPDGTFS